MASANPKAVAKALLSFEIGFGSVWNFAFSVHIVKAPRRGFSVMSLSSTSYSRPGEMVRKRKLLKILAIYSKMTNTQAKIKLFDNDFSTYTIGIESLVTFLNCIVHTGIHILYRMIYL